MRRYPSDGAHAAIIDAPAQTLQESRRYRPRERLRPRWFARRARTSHAIRSLSPNRSKEPRVSSGRVTLTTAHGVGIWTAYSLFMPSDVLTLVHRDHADLQRDLTQLLDPDATASELRTSLDGVRLGLTAHAEAEDIVLGEFEEIPEFALLVKQCRAAHLAQEHALSALVCSRPQTPVWRDRASHLRDLVSVHARIEEEHLFAVLREAFPERYQRLAGKFATERLRQLAMLQPSAPMMMPFELTGTYAD